MSVSEEAIFCWIKKAEFPESDCFATARNDDEKFNFFIKIFLNFEFLLFKITFLKKRAKNFKK